MPRSEIALQTGQQLFVRFDSSIFLLGDNRFIRASYVNDSYDTVTLLGGLVMGRVSATNMAVPLVGTANDGSQFVLGALVEDAVVEAGDTKELSIVVSGRVAAEFLRLTSPTTMETVISGRRLKDRIMADTLGLQPVGGTELTQYDNA